MFLVVNHSDRSVSSSATLSPSLSLHYSPVSILFLILNSSFFFYLFKYRMVDL